MRVGVIADVHANKPALEAVLDDIPDGLPMVCAGDVVGYYPWPGASVTMLRNRGILCVIGNHDRMVVSGGNFTGNEMARAGVRYARGILSDDQVKWLAGLPIERWVFDGRVRVVHGHPEDPDRYTFPAEFGPGLLGGEEVLVLGHTHLQFHEVYEEGIVLNPGSVGQPRDGDPRAAYSIVDLDRCEVDERRVEYDVERVRAKVNEVGLPREVGARLVAGR